MPCRIRYTRPDHTVFEEKRVVETTTRFLFYPNLTRGHRWVTPAWSVFITIWQCSSWRRLVFYGLQCAWVVCYSHLAHRATNG